MVRSWTIKEGRNKQWVSKGPWFGQGKEIEVLAKADLQPTVDKMRAYYEDGSESGPQVIREFLEAWEGSNGTK